MELRSEFAGKKVEATKTVLRMVRGDIRNSAEIINTFWL